VLKLRSAQQLHGKILALAIAISPPVLDYGTAWPAAGFTIQSSEVISAGQKDFEHSACLR
jgi:hypothetical protein